MSTAVAELIETARPEVSNSPQQISNSSPAFTKESAPPEAVLTQMITGSLGSQAIYVAAKLGIADLLVNGAKNVEELAAAAEADAPSLYRVLRALASLGVFTERDNKTFELNSTAELLRSDSPCSLRDLAIFFGEDWLGKFGVKLYTACAPESRAGARCMARKSSHSSLRTAKLRGFSTAR